MRDRLRDVSYRRSLSRRWLRHKVEQRRRMKRLLAGCIVGAVVALACAHLPSQPRARPTFWGFSGPWDRRSAASIEANASSLDRIITGWIALDTTSFRPIAAYPDE